MIKTQEVSFDLATQTCSHVYEIEQGKEYRYCPNIDVEIDGTVLSCSIHRSTTKEN